MFEDVNKVVDIILSEIPNSSKKFAVLEGGYIAKTDYIERLVTESNIYLRNLSRIVKQRQNKNHIVSVNLSDIEVNCIYIYIYISWKR